jgi:16S rRNA processing protein RimM
VNGRDTAIVGRIRRPHGVRGELFVQLITGEPDAIFAPGRRVFALPAAGPDAPVTELTVAASRPFKDGLLITFKEIGDRTAAEQWNGRHLSVPSSELAPPKEGELFLHELAGMAARSVSGESIGTVRGYYQLPQGVVLEIETPRGMRDVPFHEVFVKQVDREKRSLVVDAPEGLLD